MHTKIFIKIGLVILITISFLFSTFGQTPEMFKYQAVLRDANGNILANQNKTVVIDILKTSPSGISVFTENHSVTTTVQGIINLNIGSVNSLSGIDWTADEYFIQITVDGTIMGTSQLLSVPYALTAKTVENVSFLQLTNKPTTIAGYGITDAFDGTWVSLTGKPTFATVATSGSYTDLTNKPANATTTTNGFMSSTDKTKLDGLQNVNITAGTGISVTGTYPNIEIATTSPTYTVGLNEDLGGYVFYVTPDGKHGLVAATQDQSTSCTWYYAQDVISNPANHNTAGKKFTDWRLPTENELNLMYDQRVAITNFTANYYWSSTENNYNLATIQSFRSGDHDIKDKYNAFYVRAVRAF